MKTNDLKKGMRVQLNNGWYGTVADNAKGNIRMVTVEGYETETGSVYSHDIIWAIGYGGVDRTRIEHTAAQLALQRDVEILFDAVGGHRG